MEPALTLAAVAPIAVVAIVLGAIVAIPVGVLAVIYLIVPLFKGLAWLIKQVGVFVYSTFADILRLIGAIVTSLVLVPLTIGNVVIGRWSATAHYGRAIQAEMKNAGRSVYRLAVGNPARLLCLTPLTEGIERRIPQVMAAAPGADRPARRLGQFEGYEIVGSLAGGGSGGKLYVARPDAQKLASFARNGHHNVDQVVIKCFSQHDGTTLPQIVRENRALDAAKKMGLILEHDLSNERFHYVMRYVPGDSLNIVTQRLHAAAGNNGLARRETQEVLSYAADLLRTLRTYHEGGLWHKDVKPDNVIVSGGHAHLVDFGLVTPLRSSMTLTTHGTEYFRDPEMVRMALKGVKVHEVDGAKFDIYAVGAVIFSMIENSFPAHGGLSQITRPCPETVRWIVRRAMTDYDKRYQTAGAMLADIETVLRAADPFALRPAHLPSVAANLDHEAVTPEPVAAGPYAAPYPPTPPAHPMPPAPPHPGAGHANWSAYPGMYPNAAPAAAAVAVGAKTGRIKPDLRVTHWFSGRYAVEGAVPSAARGGASAYAAVNAAHAAAAAAVAGVAQANPGAPARAARVHPGARGSAADQLRRAKEKAAAARARVRQRTGGRAANFPAGINAGVVVALLLFMGVMGILMLSVFSTQRHARVVVGDAPLPPMPPVPALPVVVDSANARDTGVASYASTLHVSDSDRVLVVCEWSKFDPERQALIEAQLRQLEQSGFLLLGDATRVSASESAFDERDAELVAELRAAVGTRVFMSADASKSVREWMENHDEADMVVWFSGIVPGKNEIPATAWVVPAANADRPAVSFVERLLAHPEQR